MNPTRYTVAVEDRTVTYVLLPDPNLDEILQGISDAEELGGPFGALVAGAKLLPLLVYSWDAPTPGTQTRVAVGDVVDGRTAIEVVGDALLRNALAAVERNTL